MASEVTDRPNRSGRAGPLDAGPVDLVAGGLSLAALVFDLDGTLIDSAPDIRNVGSAALAVAGLAPMTLAETRACIGHGAAAFVTQALALRGVTDDAALHARVLQVFLDRYDDAVGATLPYPGVPEALAALRGAGHRLALCTNKPTRPTRAVLAHVGLTEAFEVLVCGDTLPQRKPDPAPLLAAVQALGGGAAIYVGDSEVDAATADGARLPFLLFTEGYRKRPVEDLYHSHSFADFAALPGLVDDLLR